MAHFVQFTGLKGEPLYLVARHILCVGQAFGQQKSSIDPSQIITEVVGVMVSVPGTNFVVTESLAAVTTIIAEALDDAYG